MSEKLTIWQNYDIDPDDPCWKEFFDEEYPDTNDEERWELAVDMNWDYLEDERMNLDKELYGQIVMIGSIGRWNGTFSGYTIKKAHNLADCLEFMDSCDYAEWYVEDGELRSNQTHHDGTNHVMYRLLPSGLPAEICEKLDEEDFTLDDLMEWTESLAPYVAKVYGWKIEETEKVKE